MPRQSPICPHSDASASSDGVGAGPPWRRYWPAALLAVVGLIATGLAGWQMDRWAQARDEERFAAEARLIVSMIEQKMERYESMLGRLSDACAQGSGEISSETWAGWIAHKLGTRDHYPNLVCLVVAPRITESERPAFEQRAASQVSGHPGRIITSRHDASYWLPVWRRLADPGFNEPALGDDLLAEASEHPCLERALEATVGWVSERSARLVHQAGHLCVGFWFAVPLRPMEFTNRIQWQWPYETGEQAAQRRDDQRARQAIGLLAAFIGGDEFLNEFNSTNARVRVQLFAGTTPSADALLNPGHPIPREPRYARDLPMSWYARRWTARITSTPVFEAGSLQYRAWLIRGVGSVLTLGAAAVVAWQIRGRWREAALAAQLREALARQERLSRDLHDGTLQSAYGLGLALQRAQRLLEKRPQDAARQIAETTVVLQQLIAEMRGFVRESDPGTREEVPLGEALAGVVSHLKLGTEIELQLNILPDADHGLTPAQSLQLLNIAREALSNCVRHSHARRVQIKLEQSSGVVRLEVADDGCGFDPAAAQGKGRGLVNLAARVRELGGTHRWETAAGQGARLNVEVPLATHLARAVS